MSTELKTSLPPLFTKAPKHVAIIMDGNRRWAKKHHLDPQAGHAKGAQRLVEIVDIAPEFGIEVLTVYAFSTENWRRPKAEISSLLNLLKSYLISQRPRMVQNSVKLSTIGDLSKFPSDVQTILRETIEMTKSGTKLNFVLALNYGGRNEIQRAVQDIVTDCMRGVLKKEKITEEMIGKYLDTSKFEDPDLLIRTSGESRISNFLLWQVSYSEVYVTDVLWPDFSSQALKNAIVEFQKREKREGK